MLSSAQVTDNRAFGRAAKQLAKSLGITADEARDQLTEQLRSAGVLVDATTEQEESMPRGRKPKTIAKAPTKLERGERLREKILNLVEHLMADGYAAFLKPTGSVPLVAPAIEDPKTGGIVGHVEEPLGTYLQRVSIVDNFQQRPPFDHVSDSIYKRLIRDFITGATMPEAKVAALSGTANDRVANSLDEPAISYSIIDGLQRLYCFCIAVLLVWQRDELVRDGSIPREAWEYFKDSVAETGDPRTSTEHLLQRTVRYEVFYRIDLGGLLHYMVTFNTGQRRMSLPVQLEIMRKPLIDELRHKAKIQVWNEMQKMPGMSKPKDQFAAADLVLTTEAFITNNAQLTASSEAERFLNQDQGYLENVGEINDVVETLARITTEIHPQIMKVYADDPSRRFILSAGGTFLLSFAAACGYVRNRNNRKMLDGALDKLMTKLQEPKEDPLGLESYGQALASITASRGKAIRRLVYDTFLRFFSGATTELEWLDTASQITGVAS